MFSCLTTVIVSRSANGLQVFANAPLSARKHSSCPEPDIVNIDFSNASVQQRELLQLFELTIISA